VTTSGTRAPARRFGAFIVLIGFVGVLALPIALAQTPVPKGDGDRVNAELVKIHKGADFTITRGPIVADATGQALTPALVSGDGSPGIVDNSQLNCKQPGCQNYRLELDLDPDSSAINFLQITLDWDITATVPPLGLVAVSLRSTTTPGLNMYAEPEDFAWDIEDDPNTPQNESSDYNYRDHRNQDGASFDGHPEKTAITSTDGTNVYYLSVTCTDGVAASYTLHFQYSNELFGPQDELLPPGFHGNTGSIKRPAPNTGAGAAGGGLVLSPGGPSSLNRIGKVPIGADGDFAGFGLDINSGVGKNTAADLGNARDAAAVRAPNPGAPAILLWVLLVPIGLASIGGTWIYRRRPASLRA
jgi:hypothetical protein